MDPSKTKFSVLWSNNANHNRRMTTHALTLREGLTCDRLHLDQVHIIFRPSASITTSEFIRGDSADLSWRAETSQLLIRTTPGERHTIYVTASSDDTFQSVVRSPHMSLTYSAALSVCPDAEGSEDLWCRTYRPVRDMPVAHHLYHSSELSIELLFPLLIEDERTQLQQIPDYRILKVLCEFSVDK